MNFRNICRLLVLFLLFVLSVPAPIYISASTETNFAPSTCAGIENFKTHVIQQVDDRVAGLSANDTTKKIFTSQDFTTQTYVRNPDVWTNNGTTSLDLTGISPWNSTGGATRAGTLISPRHIIFARHYSINVGATITFVGNDNQVVTKTLTAKTNAPLYNDITVGLLDSDVPSWVTHYPILTWSQLGTYSPGAYGLPMLVLDQEEKALVRDSSAIGTSIYRVGEITKTLYHAVPPATSTRNLFSEPIVGGDSGNPGFIIIDGKPVLMFAHWGDTTGPLYSYHLDEINNVMTSLGGGYTASTYDLSCFDHSPVITSPASNTNFILAENASVNTPVATTTATDLDSNSLVFSISSGNEDGAFSINSSTGVLRVASTTLLDYETKDYYSLTIRATDNSPSMLFSEVTINILLQNQNENPPYIISSNFDVSEPLEGEISIGQLLFIFEDLNPGAVTFELLSENETFTINSTGEIFLKSGKIFDYEEQNLYDLEIKILGNNSLFSTSTVTVNVLDSLEPSPVVLTTNLSVDENKTGTYHIGDIEYESEALPVQFSFSSLSDVFSISSTGDVSLKDGQLLDYETSASYVLSVNAVDKNGVITATDLTISINNIEESTGGGSGGGGGGSSKKSSEVKPKTSPASTIPAPITTAPNLLPTSLSPVTPYTRSLTLGSSGEDVRSLQKFLNSKGFVIAKTGPGSVGNETIYFGPATQTALAQFQSSVGIIPALGYFGPVTLSKISKETGDIKIETSSVTNPAAALNLSGNPTNVLSTPISSPVTPYTRSLTLGSSGEDVRSLQKFLNSKGFVIAKTGPGSVGNETIYFGPATQTALAQFQSSVGIIPALGYFGPVTQNIITKF